MSESEPEPPKGIMTSETQDPQQQKKENVNTAPSVDVTANNFMQEVMEPSASQVVILDFWAPWCGPCKSLLPLLEKVIGETGGAAKLAKINIDENPQLAQQLQVQSVPTVFAFFGSQLIDGFMGALPESQIREWLISLIKKTGAKSTNQEAQYLEEALKHAHDCFQTDDVKTALAIYSSIIEKHPAQIEAFAGVLRCLLVLGEAKHAAEILAKAPPAITNDKLLIPIKTAIELAQQAEQSQEQSTDPLLAQLETNAEDHQARFDLALAYYAQNDTESAIRELLEIVKRDRKWQDEAARTQLVKIFEALGHMHPVTIEARKKLSTILFA